MDNNRIIKVEGSSLGSPERWKVLDENYRDIIYRGTFEQCVKFLQNQCPTGACES